MSDSSTSNLPERTVSELSQALKRTIETTYDRVRVRGELGRVVIARSGHMYADIKDDKAVLNTVMWKGQVNRLPFRPEEGLEVIATGRLSTYPGRSNYQLIAEDMRPAGVGALMALLEERKKKLAAEGLFDKSHKKPLPFLPSRIGVVTSPTGAVIRDILHRIRDRFPREVILWPALVQGDTAAAQIVAGIRGFNAMPEDQRPDVLIVGRGGGSIEDLWPFNEEPVVRAAFESAIPLISAVGHETDTTLIDYVADARAPTPTGAAEIAVPVRTELNLQIESLTQRQKQALNRLTQRAGERLQASRLPRPDRLLAERRQRFDLWADRLPTALQTLALKQRARLERIKLEQYAPDRRVQAFSTQLAQLSHGLSSALRHATTRQRMRFDSVTSRLRSAPLQQTIQRRQSDLDAIWSRIGTSQNAKIEQKKSALLRETKLLEALSYQAVLKRGFSVIRTPGPKSKLVRDAQTAAHTPELEAVFHDGAVSMRPVGPSSETAVDPTPVTKPEKPRPPQAKPGNQGDLF